MALAIGCHADVLSYLIGPAVYPLRRRKWAAYTQALMKVEEDGL